jgi:hypothetical protein
MPSIAHAAEICSPLYGLEADARDQTQGRQSIVSTAIALVSQNKIHNNQAQMLSSAERQGVHDSQVGMLLGAKLHCIVQRE